MLPWKDLRQTEHNSSVLAISAIKDKQRWWSIWYNTAGWKTPMKRDNTLEIIKKDKWTGNKTQRQKMLFKKYYFYTTVQNKYGRHHASIRGKADCFQQKCHWIILMNFLIILAFFRILNKYFPFLRVYTTVWCTCNAHIFLWTIWQHLICAGVIVTHNINITHFNNKLCPLHPLSSPLH